MPEIRVAPGDRLMFVNRTGHEYDERCQEYEIVTVVKVRMDEPLGRLLVKVQWPSGFVHRVQMEDLSEMPSLPGAGGSVGTEAVPDFLGDSDRRHRRHGKSRSPSTRASAETEAIPDFLGDGDRRHRRHAKSRSPSRRDIRRMPDIPTHE